ncbi:hypothetical protein Ais01nite_82740 [Asanoa ishikariensis]|nr:hypothetical protein Ais01nite_82740 [Asanoa ishikariensis]
MTGVLGALVAAAGMILVLSSFRDSPDGREILVGGILVVAGLLLRIEGAIWASRDEVEVEPDPDGDRQL